MPKLNCTECNKVYVHETGNWMKTDTLPQGTHERDFAETVLHAQQTHFVHKTKTARIPINSLKNFILMKCINNTAERGNRLIDNFINNAKIWLEPK